jgi:hypothetical protein
MATSKRPNPDEVLKAAAAAFREIIRSAEQTSDGDTQYEMVFMGAAISLMLAKVSAGFAAASSTADTAAERGPEQQLSKLAELAGLLLPEVADDLAVALTAANLSRGGTC